MPVVAAGRTQRRRGLIDGERRHDGVEAALAHQAPVDAHRRSLAPAHGDRNVGRPVDEIAARKHAFAAGGDFIAVDADQAVLLGLETRGAAEIGIDAFARREDDVVADLGDDFAGVDRTTASRAVEAAKTGPYQLDRFDCAVFGDDAVRRGEKHELDALLFRRLDFLGDCRHIFAIAPINRRSPRRPAHHGARAIDRRVAAADDDHAIAELERLVARLRLEERQRAVDAGDFAARQA